MTIPRVFADLINIVYPEACAGCGQPLVSSENLICLECMQQLPTTDFHKIQENPVLKIFSGRAKIERAAAYFYFEKDGIVQALLHALKYEKRPEVGTLLGKMAGRDLAESDFLKNVDFLVPIPLHPKKLKKRGYNQSLVLAEAISVETGIPVSFGNLTRDVFTETQTRKSRFARWKNVEKIFTLKNPAAFEDKHMLLIDDVITTGSTAEGGAIQFLAKPNAQVSFLSLAISSK